MIIKKYTSDTEQGAILLAKEDLGSEAIVMNIKTMKPKGLKRFFVKVKVEVTAAVDEDKDKVQKEQTPAPHSPRVAAPAGVADNRSAFLPEPTKDKVAAPSDGETTAIEKKLDHLQSLYTNIEKKITETREKKVEDEVPQSQSSQGEEDEELDKVETCKKLIFEQLLQNEVTEEYAGQLMDEIQRSIKPESSLDAILGNVYQKIILKLGQAKVIDTEDAKRKFIFFVGPTGVGKTTTIAKIASDLKLNKRLNVAMVTADTYRIAAVEQLKTYANILGVPLKVVYSVEDMKEHLAELMEYDVVLIDTAGRSHLSDEHAKELKDLLDCLGEEEREVFLVLSTTTKYRDLVMVTEVYDGIAKYNLIFTKLDETSCIGNIYNIRVLTNASLSYTTSGQNVPDDISKMDPQNIAKQLLGGGT